MRWSAFSKSYRRLWRTKRRAAQGIADVARRFLFVSSALAVSALPLAAEAIAGEAKELRIGVLYWSMNIPGQVAMRQGLEGEAAKIDKAAEAKGLPKLKLEASVAGDGEEGIERQIAQMEELVKSRPDAIIVQPTDNAALAGPLKMANKAGIPVVAYDQYVSGGELAAFISSDNYQAGYLDGEYVCSKLPPEKALRIVLVEYPHVSSTVERVDGFIDAIATAKRNYKVLKSYSAVEPVGGAKAGKEILRDFPEPGSIDIVFTVNDGGGLAVVKELAEAGRKEILVATIDGDPASIENIRAGRLTVIDAAQFCGPLGAEALKTAYSILTGGKPPRRALVPAFPVAKETLDIYPGWQGPAPASFKKPWKSLCPLWTGAIKDASRPKGSQ